MLALRYWHTLRYLKPVQIVGRARLLFPYARLDEGPPPVQRRRDGPWCRPASRAPSMEGPNRFRFLNRCGTLGISPGWNAAAHDKLWLYNLQYFDDLNAVGSSTRSEWHRALIARWILENPPGHRNGWE